MSLTKCQIVLRRDGSVEDGKEDERHADAQQSRQREDEADSLCLQTLVTSVRP
jgi:hypothetical protein